MIRFLLPFTAIVAMTLIPPFSVQAGKFEVVASTSSSDATLQDYAIVPSPDGKGETMVMNFRRDEFFIAVDLRTGKIKQHSLKPGQAWAITSGPDGKVYLGTSLSPGARLLRYDPATDQVEELAKLEGEQILAWLAFDAKGNLYGGAYPSTSLYRFRDGKVENLGAMAPGQTHNVFGAISAQGKVYSGIGMNEETLIEYNPETREKRNIWPAEWKAKHSARVYLGEDGLVYSYPGIENEASKGKALRINNDGSIEQIPRRQMARQAEGCYPKSLPARPKLANGSVITEVTRDKIVIVPESGGEPRVLELDYEGAVKPIFGFGFGGDGKIYGSSKPAVLFSFDPEQDHFESLLAVSPHKAGQVYRKVAVGGKVYMGSYTHGMFHVFDPQNPTERTRTIGPIGAGQDRPVDMVAGKNGFIYIASYPGYGSTNGALTYFDSKTEKFENFPDIIPHHSLNAIALDEDRSRIYVGSSNMRGVGTPALETDAIVGEWDVKEKRMLRTLQPVPGEKLIAALTVLPNGMICGITGQGVWFGIDPKSMQVTVTQRLEGGAASLARLVVHEKKGFVYGLAGSAIWRAPLENPEKVENLDRYTAKDKSIHYGIEMDRQGRLYFADGRQLVRWTPNETQ